MCALALSPLALRLLRPQLRFKIQNTVWSWIAIVILFVVVLFYFKNYPLKRGELRQCAVPSHGWKITTTTINKNWSDQCNGLSVDRDYDCRVIKEIYLQNARISLLLRLFCFRSLVCVSVWMCAVVVSFRFFSLDVGLGKVLSYWINRFNMYINEMFFLRYCCCRNALFVSLFESLLFCNTVKIAPFVWDRFEPVNINLRWFYTNAFVHSFSFLDAP